MFTVAASATTAALHCPPLLVASRGREVVHAFGVIVGYFDRAEKCLRHTSGWEASGSVCPLCLPDFCHQRYGFFDHYCRIVIHPYDARVRSYAQRCPLIDVWRTPKSRSRFLE